LIGYLNQVRQAAPPGVLVATADVYSTFLQNPGLIAASDLVLANFFGYFEGTSIDNATCALIQQYQNLSAAAGSKRVAVSEAGWPSQGPANEAAVPSPANAARYALELLSWADSNGVPMFYFEAFDEPWKAAYEGPQGAFWGIWDTNGVLKFGMDQFFSGQNTAVSCGGALPGPVGIRPTFVPVYGSSLQLEVQATGIRPQDYAVATYINVSGNYWSKPYFAQPSVTLNSDGSARIPIVTGGYDTTATDIVAFLIPATLTPPIVGPGSLPSIPSAVASFHVPRTASSIYGRVTDSQGNPVAGATVSEPVLGATSTAPDGYYSYYSISATGPVTITVSRQGYTFPSSPATSSITSTSRQIDFVAAALPLVAQSIAFPPLVNVILGASFILNATASSGLPVTFAATAPSVCAVYGVTVTTIAPGLCGISASQPGNASYAAAPAISRSFTILAPQTISFTRPPDTSFGVPTVVVSVSASSDLPVTIISGSSAICTVSGNTVKVVGAGTCSLVASQAGDTVYAPAASVTQSFLVARASQTIAFAALADMFLGDPAVQIAASATSTLPVALASTTPAVCGVTGVLLSTIAAGDCFITATQSGDVNYTSAPPVTRGFRVLVKVSGPSIQDHGVVALYSTAPIISSGAWISIYGANFASTTYTWNGDYPRTLGGVSVTINGKPASLWFVGPTQINLQAPDDSATGTVSVTVGNAVGSATATVTLSAFSPSLILAGARYVAGVIPTADGSGAYGAGTYDLLGAAADPATRPARSGEIVELFGVGFGPTSPPVPAGRAFSGAAPAINAVIVTVGGVPAEVLFAGEVSGGLFQINIVVPAAGTGDRLVQAMVGGLSTEDNAYLPVR
jgi:uncharacterized protein (TIGR03437 family)